MLNNLSHFKSLFSSGGFWLAQNIFRWCFRHSQIHLGSLILNHWSKKRQDMHSKVPKQSKWNGTSEVSTSPWENSVSASLVSMRSSVSPSSNCGYSISSIQKQKPVEFCATLHTELKPDLWTNYPQIQARHIRITNTQTFRVIMTAQINLMNVSHTSHPMFTW